MSKCQTYRASIFYDTLQSIILLLVLQWVDIYFKFLSKILHLLNH